MISHVIAAAMTAAIVGTPLAYALWRAQAELRRLRAQHTKIDWIAEAVTRIDQQTEVNGVRLKKLRETLRQQSLSEADTQPVNHLRVIGGYRGSRGA